MLQKLKRLLVVGVAALALTFAVPMMADAGVTHGPPGYYIAVKGGNQGKIQYFSNGHPINQSQWEFIGGGSPGCSNCEQTDADVGINIGVGFPAVDDYKTMGFAEAGGRNLVLTASATATGKDLYFLWWKVQDAFGHAEAHVDDLYMKVGALVFSNGEKHNGGLSFTTVLGIGTLEFNASAFAEGNFGCLQMASVALSGKFGTKAGGYAYSTVDSNPNAYSLTEGEGHTIVGVSAFDAEVDKYDFKWWIIPTDVDARAEIEGKVKVYQGLLVTAYTSPDGMTTINFGSISGGSAKAYGDASLTSVKANGTVMQQAQAVGPGAYAYGTSQASYVGAGGNVTEGRRGTEIANANGLAVVTGYNNITHTGSTLHVSSHQTAYATTKQ